jgi:hypothetical protein
MALPMPPFDSVPHSVTHGVEALGSTIKKGTDWLLANQEPEGFWVGMVESNSAIEAEWLLAGHILGIELPGEADLVTTLLSRQRRIANPRPTRMPLVPTALRPSNTLVCLSGRQKKLRVDDRMGAAREDISK